jgi:hypothetical protein
MLEAEIEPPRALEGIKKLPEEPPKDSPEVVPN